MTTKPQQPELRRSGAAASIDLDAVEAETDARDIPVTGGDTGPVPKANKPGSPSGPVQDKPDLDAFAAKLGKGKGDDESDSSEAEDELAEAVSPLREIREVLQNRDKLAVRGLTTSLRVLAVSLRWTAAGAENLADRLRTRKG